MKSLLKLSLLQNILYNGIAKNLPYLLHFASDQLFRELGVMPCHVYVGMSKNLCQYIDWHTISTERRANVWWAQWVVNFLLRPHIVAISVI